MTGRLHNDIKKLCAELGVAVDRKNARFFPSADVIRRVATAQQAKQREDEVGQLQRIMTGPPGQRTVASGSKDSDFDSACHKLFCTCRGYTGATSES